MVHLSLTHLSLFTAVLSLWGSLAMPTEVMHRPAEFLRGSTSSPSSTTRDLDLEKRTTAPMVHIGYFTNWGIYGSNFQPSDVIPSTLTHLLYAFADVDPNTGTIVLSDLYADEQKHFANDSWDEPGNNLYGCLKQFYLIKKANRNLKVLLSVGGYTYSQSNHFSFVTNPALRATFVASAVTMIENLGLDGIDLDFEYPANTAQGSGFASLFTALRTAFDQLAATKGDKTPYQLTAAVSAGTANSAFLDVPTMDKALNYWNLMAYDYAGSWSAVSDNQANLFGGQGFSNTSTDAAVKSYIARGATPSKISVGIPIYGRGFEGTSGMHQPFTGVGTGTAGGGVWNYKDLPPPGSTVTEDMSIVASYSFDATKQELISYDTPTIVTRKAQYVVSNGLAGSMFWELSADKLGNTSLVRTSMSVYTSGLDQTLNHLSYPDSIFTNMANGMSGDPIPTTVPTTASSTVSVPTVTVSSPSTSTSGTSTSTSAPSGGSCSGVAAWNSQVAYTGGQQATYNAHLWTARWWTQADTPGGAAGVWTDNGACS